MAARKPYKAWRIGTFVLEFLSYTVCTETVL